MTDAQHGYADASGTKLYYEIRGDGPLLLVIQGGAGDARFSAGLVSALAADFTVLTYDRRGIARSSASGSPTEVTMWTHAADAAAVLTTVDSGPARVFGTSIGALIGLHLLVAEPDLVHRLVAHEPPMSALVHDPEREAAMDGVQRTFAEQGPMAAMRRMLAVIGLHPLTMEFEPGATPPPPSETAAEDFTTFFTHDYAAVRRATLLPADIPPTRRADVTPSVGETSRGAWEYRCAEALAAALERPILELAGGHNGMLTHPATIARALSTEFT